jgi:hypothetical protein
VQTDLDEAKGLKRLARIMFKKDIAAAKTSKHMASMRINRTKAFGDDKHRPDAMAAMDRHRRASIRFNRISKGQKPFQTEGLSLPHMKGKGVASILAAKHNRLADKYAYGDHKKLSFHARAAQRLDRIAHGRKPFQKDVKNDKQFIS